MSYSLGSSKNNTPNCFHREPKCKGLISNIPFRHRPQATPLPSRSSSSNYIIPSKALVRRKSTNFPSERSCDAPGIHGGSRISTPGDKKNVARDYFGKWQDEYDHDEGLMTVEDGSTIIIAPPGTPIRVLKRTKSGDLVASDPQSGKQITRAVSAGDLRSGGSHNERIEKGLGSPYSVKFDLYGLVMAKRLRSHLLHLYDILGLYLTFDSSSGSKSASTAQPIHISPSVFFYPPSNHSKKQLTNTLPLSSPQTSTTRQPTPNSPP